MMYDFDGDTENGELVLKEGDILTITNKVNCTCVCVSVSVCVHVRVFVHVQVHCTPLL